MDTSDEKGFTLTISGVGPWEKRATEAEARRMAVFVKMADTQNVTTRCGTCAFRTGTDANGSSLVVRCIDHTLQSGGSFMCHAVGEDEERECAGFAIVKKAYTPIVHPVGPPNRTIVEGRQPT